MFIAAIIIAGLIGYLGIGLLYTVCLVHLNIHLSPFYPDQDAAFFILFWPLTIPFSLIYLLTGIPSQINRKLNKLVRFLTSR
jgi:hypothetical protein